MGGQHQNQEDHDRLLTQNGIIIKAKKTKNNKNGACKRQKLEDKLKEREDYIDQLNTKLSEKGKF